MAEKGPDIDGGIEELQLQLQLTSVGCGLKCGLHILTTARLTLTRPHGPVKLLLSESLDRTRGYGALERAHCDERDAQATPAPLHGDLVLSR